MFSQLPVVTQTDVHPVDMIRASDKLFGGQLQQLLVLGGWSIPRSNKDARN